MASCIAELELENLTYTIPGGFNAAPYSIRLGLWEMPRAQSFKGLWRWWLRALLSGALWGAGKYDREKVQQATKNLLGSIRCASKFIIHVSVEGEAKPLDAQAIEKWKRIWKQLTITPNVLLKNFPSSPSIPPLPPRLFLILQARESNQRLAERVSTYQPGDLKITIKLLKRPFIDISSRECSIAISSLILSLIFGGIGAISRRGFGSLSFTQVRINEELWEYEDLIKDIMKTNDPSKLRELLCQLIKMSLTDARELLGVKSTTGSDEVPDHSLLSEPGDPPEDVRPFNLNIFTLSIPNVTNKERSAFQLLGFRDYETMKLLTLIGYSTMKLFWKLADGEEFDAHGFHWETWVMGLPRGQKIDKQRLRIRCFNIDLHEDGTYIGKVPWDVLKTGYSSDNKDRRASAISIKPIKRLGERSWIIALHGFLSRDWNDTLYHYGVTPPPKRGRDHYRVEKRRLVPPQDIDRAFVKAWVRLKKIYGVR